MASRSKKVAKAVPFSSADLASLKDNPYLQRLVSDQELQNNIRTALDSSRRAIDRVTSSKAPQRAVFVDKKLQKDLRQAAQSLRSATSALNDAPNRRRKKGLRLGRTLLLVLVGAGVALAASESLRSKVLDTMFGAEEEFQYTPPAGAPSEPPASPVSAA